jgi:hypothetical protein
MNAHLYNRILETAGATPAVLCVNNGFRTSCLQGVTRINRPDFSHYWMVYDTTFTAEEIESIHVEDDLLTIHVIKTHKQHD